MCFVGCYTVSSSLYYWTLKHHVSQSHFCHSPGFFSSVKANPFSIAIWDYAIIEPCTKSKVPRCLSQLQVLWSHHFVLRWKQFSFENEEPVTGKTSSRTDSTQLLLLTLDLRSVSIPVWRFLGPCILDAEETAAPSIGCWFKHTATVVV